MPSNPLPCFAKLVDPPRETRNKLHALQDIVMITLCATLCGHDDWVGIEDVAHENEAWLREFLPRANGTPSHAPPATSSDAWSTRPSPKPSHAGCRTACRASMLGISPSTARPCATRGRTAAPCT